MKKLLFLLSLLLIIACNPNTTSSKGNILPPLSSSNPGSVDWGSESSIKPTISSNDKVESSVKDPVSTSTSSVSSETNNVTTPNSVSSSLPNVSSSSSVVSSQTQSSSSSSSSEDKPSNVLPGEGFGGLH